MMPYRLISLLLCLALTAAGAQAALHHRPESSVRATVHFLGAAAGKYALLADNGVIFEPTNLKRAYQVDGMRVKFTAKRLVSPAPSIAGARVVKITSIHTLPWSGGSAESNRIAGSAGSTGGTLRPPQAGAPGTPKWP